LKLCKNKKIAEKAKRKINAIIDIFDLGKEEKSL